MHSKRIGVDYENYGEFILTEDGVKYSKEDMYAMHGIEAEGAKLIHEAKKSFKGEEVVLVPKFEDEDQRRDWIRRRIDI